ncbi:MAG: isomerizing glutamine--fructose-6-phosphate transaminase, partial [Proteobacteria bacterium]|nr:isomerizing glutamine--fructose-6-phosphate transaminase [Pseudomonadota bacterium]
MCGIVAYIGEKQALPILIEGLKRLEYRGYDSAGVAIWNGRRFEVRKKAGKVKDLESQWKKDPIDSTVGMGHTRWATHGVPSDSNAHPHADCDGKIVVIHNGVIENYSALKTLLAAKGHVFHSETDTEVLAHLIEEFRRTTSDLDHAVRSALQEVDGTYGLVVLSSDCPDQLVVARRGSPLVIGYGDGEVLVASDASALVQHTRKVTYLEDGEVAVITRDSVETKTLDDVRTLKKIEDLEIDLEQIEKGGYAHFMLKEINEQPDTITNSMRGRLRVEDGLVTLGGLGDSLDVITKAERIIILACGTSWHAALIGEYMLEPAKNMAEIALSVTREFQGKGLGRILIKKLSEAARENGIAGLFAYT